jgi:hypothetical protein
MAFSYKAAITIGHASVSANLTGFPVLISETLAGSAGKPDLRTVAHGGHVQNSNGYDIYVYSDSALTTRLPVERVSYDASTGAIRLWVKASISSSSDTVLYLAFGDSGISTDPNSDGTHGTTSAWDANFKAVWHLEEASGAVADSTANANNGTAGGTGITYGATGKIGKAVTVGGTASEGYFGAGNPSSLQITGQITLSAWVRAANLTESSDRSIISKLSADSSTVGGYELMYTSYMATGSNRVFGCEFDGNSGASSYRFVVSSPLSAAAWYHVVATYDPSTDTTHLYVNGSVDEASTDFTGSMSSINNSTRNLQIGKRSNGGGTVRDWDGDIDEVRISNTVRSVAWIATEYANQNSPSTFYGVGSETSTTSGIDGSASLTQDAETVSASGTVEITGSVAKTQAAQTASAAGTVEIAASAAPAQESETVSAGGSVDITASASVAEDGDTLSAQGGSDAVSGSANLTQGDDSVSASGSVDVEGASSPTQDDQTVSAAAAVPISGATAATQEDQQVAASGELPIAGSGAMVQDAETVAAAGDVPVSASAAITQAGESLSAAGAVPITGSGASMQDSDTLQAGDTGSQAGSASLQQDDQAVAAATSVGITGAATKTQQGESVSGAGSVGISGGAAIAQGAQEAQGAGTGEITGQATRVQQGETVQGAGSVAIDGAGTITQGPQTLIANDGTVIHVLMTTVAAVQRTYTVAAITPLKTVAAVQRTYTVEAVQ